MQLCGKTVIVTGSNTGIGKETALQLATRGAKVILACRDLERANDTRLEIIRKTNNADVYVYELDLGSFPSIRRFVKRYAWMIYSKCLCLGKIMDFFFYFQFPKSGGSFRYFNK